MLSRTLPLSEAFCDADTARGMEKLLNPAPVDESAARRRPAAALPTSRLRHPAVDAERAPSGERRKSSCTPAHEVGPAVFRDQQEVTDENRSKMVAVSPAGKP